MFKKFLSLFQREKYEVVATLKTHVTWSDTITKKKSSEDVITWYMEQTPSGKRRYFFHSFGSTKERKIENQFEAELILWKKTGILPEDAEAVDFAAMKR